MRDKGDDGKTISTVGTDVIEDTKEKGPPPHAGLRKFERGSFPTKVTGIRTNEETNIFSSKGQSNGDCWNSSRSIHRMKGQSETKKVLEKLSLRLVIRAKSINTRKHKSDFCKRC